MKKENFQKGNINFEFLQPEPQKKEISVDEGKGQIEEKRGIFFQKKILKPIKKTTILIWIGLFCGSLFTIGWSLYKGKSFIWLLVLPIPLLSLLWSAMMILLVFSRPR